MLKKYKLTQIISATALMSVASVAIAGTSNPSITLTQTVGTDTTVGVCATSSVAVVTLADSVNFCYLVTNDGDVPFDLHAVSSDIFGALSPSPTGILAPAESMQFNDIRTLSSDVFNAGTWEASNLPTINITTSTGGFEDISSTGTLIAGTGADGGLADDGEVNVTIPFSFTYFGVTSTDLCVGNNGAAIFGVTGCAVEWDNAVGGLTTPNSSEFGMIAPFWDDLGFNAFVGDLYTETLGTAPNRRFIVQWHEEVYFQPGGTVGNENITLQLALFESTNEIQFRYQDVIFGGGNAGRDSGLTAEIGLVSPDGSTSEVFSSQGGTIINDDDVISFTFTPSPSASDTSVVAVNVLIPQVTTDGILSSTLEEGNTGGTAVLDISNTGEGVLNWATNEASVAFARAPRPISFYTPEFDLTASPFEAPVDLSSKFGLVNKKSLNNTILSMAGSPVAFAVDIAGVSSWSFGSFDYETAGDYNSVGALTVAHWAGDFIGEDFSEMYSVSEDGDLNTIDTATGALTLVAAISGVDGTTITGITEDPTDGTVYAVAFDGADSSLFTLDVTTAVVTLVDIITNATLIIDIAASPTGELYAVDISSDVLVAIDSATAAGTVIGGLGFNANFGQGMDFDNSSNTLYLAAFNGDDVAVEIRTVDVATGVTTLIGTNASYGQLASFGIAAPIETCYLQEDIPWLSLSTTSGATASGDTDQVTLTFDATSLLAGTYSAKVCLFSDDPDEALLKLPVTLEVTLSDLIFENGFETP